MKIEAIALDLIDAPHDDDRLERSADDISSRAADMRVNGLINPVLIEPREDRYECVAGWTRVLAAHQLGWATIMAQIHEPMEARLRTRLRFAENMERSNLSPIEEARRLASMQAGESLSVDGIAALVHRSPDWVVSRLNLLAIPEDLQAHVHLKSLSIGAALALGRVTDPQHRAHLLSYALDGGATVETVRAWVAEWTVHQASGAVERGEPPPLPVLNQPTIVQMPCARCHAAHDVRQSCIIRVCQPCGRELEAELRSPV